MRSTSRTLLVAVIVLALAVPSIALANGQGKSGERAAMKTERKAEKASRKAENSADKQAAKEARETEREAAKEARETDKAARKATKLVAKQARKAGRFAGSSDASGSAEASGSTEPTSGAGIANAFSRITANIEKSLAKIAAGKKRQVPPGLIRVWQKFAGWLGVDSSTMPGTVAEPAPAQEPTSTIEPSSTVEPSATVEPSSTVVP